MTAGEKKSGAVPTPGWSLSRTVGLVVAVVAGFATLLMMANEGQLSRGPLLGLVTVVLMAVGLLEALGIRRSDELRGAAGRLDWRAILLHPATIGLVIGIALLAPSIGRMGLWDPWETHYGEVAREIVARDDWISLWWAQDGWFFSKPILIFWLEAISMAAFGVNCQPDANPPSPELAVRLPVFLFSIVALAFVAGTVHRIWGRRAGILAALVLCTMPHFFFLSHQAITDMLFVASMTMAMCCLLMGLATDPEHEAPVVRVGAWSLSARHLVLGLLLVASLPQILYLVSRNVTLVGGFKFAWHLDRFTSGSAGNGGVPGNPTPVMSAPVATWLQPALQAVLWFLLLGTIVFLVRRERRARPLWFLSFYFCAALSTMGKGIPGFALPGLVMLLYLIASRRWALLRELRLGTGALIVLVVAMPWFVATTARHGQEFINRLVVHDHLNRLAAGVHGDNGSVQYFIWQLGYAMFPWVALAPPAIVSFMYEDRRAGEIDTVRAAARRVLAIWFISAFALFSLMVTKFHHYIFPAVPPVAVLVALLLDRCLDRLLPEKWTAPRALGWLAVAVGGVLATVLGIAGFIGGPRGILPEGASGREAIHALAWDPVFAGSALAFGVLLVATVVWRVWRGRPADDAAKVEPASTPGSAEQTEDEKKAQDEKKAEGEWRDVALAASAIAGFFVVAFVGRDLAWVTASRPYGYERLIHLFVYNYDRAWPPQFDYGPILTGFALTATLVVALLAFRRLRAGATVLLAALAMTFTIWSLDVYMMDLTPHWSQADLIHRYYAVRHSPREELIAYQMNWKGENFYTGNRVGAFVDLDTAQLRHWADQHRGQRHFFVLEPGRLSGLRSALGNNPEVEHITTERADNKFILVAARL